MFIKRNLNGCALVLMAIHSSQVLAARCYLCNEAFDLLFVSAL